MHAPRTRHRSILVPLVALVLALPLAAGCERLPERLGGPTPTPTATRRAAARPTADADAHRSVSADGRLVRPLAPQPLSFETAGRLAEVLVHEGEVITEGQALARIEIEGLDLSAADARAAVAQAQNAVQKLERGSQVEQARLQVEQAKNQLWGIQSQRDSICGARERAEKLGGAAKLAAPSSAECNAAQANVQASEQGVLLAEAALRSAEASAPGDLAAARAQLAQAHLALQSALDRGNKAVLHAPFGGTVETVQVVEGVQIAPGAPVMTLLPEGALRFVTTNLSERNVGDVAVGAGARVTLAAYPDRDLPAVVRRIPGEGAEDPTGVVVFPVELDVEPSGLELRAGMTGRVEIDVEVAGSEATATPEGGKVSGPTGTGAAARIDF